MVGHIQGILSDEPVNRGRQPELDIAKAVLVFFLAFIHCTIECTPEENLISGIPYLFDTVIGGPLSAPMFMFAMGVGMVYTREGSAGDLAKRGLRIFTAGFVLNACRYTIPYLLGYVLTADYEKFIEPLLYRTLCNDILQFAGLAMLLIAWLRKLKTHDLLMLGIGLVLSLGGTWLNDTDAGSPLGNIFLGYLVGTTDAAGMVRSDFPLLNWFIVPVAGYVFGRVLIRVRDKRIFYEWLSPPCLLATIIYFAIGIKTGRGMFGEGQNCYYHIVTEDVLMSLVGAVGILGVYFYLQKRLPEYSIGWIREISRNVTRIYGIHWVLITLTVNVFLYKLRGTQELMVPAVMLLALGITAAAITLAHFWPGKARSRTGGRERSTK